MTRYIQNRAFQVAQLVKNPPVMQEPWFNSWIWKFPWRRNRLTHSSILGLSWWLGWYRIRQQCRLPGFDPWVGKIPWRRVWQLTLVFLPGESRSWWTEVLAAGYILPAKSWTWQSDWAYIRKNPTFFFIKCLPKFFCYLNKLIKVRFKTWYIQTVGLYIKYLNIY